MKDSEFIELLNLYLDHKITAADAARLEAEVLQNPARRRVYQDYCRMQKACKILAQDFVEEAVPANPKVVAFATARRAGSRTGWILGGSFAAAAACVALVFVSQKHETPAAPLARMTPAHEESVSIPSAVMTALMITGRPAFKRARTPSTVRACVPGARVIASDTSARALCSDTNAHVTPASRRAAAAPGLAS